MPLPKPREGEDKNTYIPRCIRFVHRESRSQREPAQIQAMCISNFERFKRTQKSFQIVPTFKALGNALLIEGDLLAPGTFIGLDGVPTHYSNKFIQRIAPSIIGKPIRFAHEISSTSMLKKIPKGTTIGFWTGYKKGETLKVRGYTFDPIAIEYLKRHPHLGLSMEAQVYSEYESELGVEDAKSGTLTGGALIDDPACPACRISTVREVSLGDRIKAHKVQNLKGVLNVTEEDLEELEEELEDEGEEKTAGLKEAFLEFSEKDLAKPTRGAFFTWLKKQLIDSGIAENLTGKILGVIKKAVKSPYPYPSPRTAEKRMEATDDSDTKVDLQDLWEKVKAALKGVVPDNLIDKVVSALKGVIKSPYPGATTEESALAKQLAEVKAELKVLQDERELVRTAEYEKILGEVKAFDEEFDEKTLEKIECTDMRRIFLERYLAALKKRVKPIQLQIGKDKAETQVSAVVEEMFGEQTFNQIFDIPEKKGD